MENEISSYKHYKRLITTHIYENSHNEIKQYIFFSTACVTQLIWGHSVGVQLTLLSPDSMTSDFIQFSGSHQNTTANGV